MSFSDNFEIRDTGIFVKRGRFREQDWWEPCFEGAPVMISQVYRLMESVYNMGEHDGRNFVRREVKKALDIESL